MAQKFDAPVSKQMQVVLLSISQMQAVSNELFNLFRNQSPEEILECIDTIKPLAELIVGCCEHAGKYFAGKVEENGGTVRID